MVELQPVRDGDLGPANTYPTGSAGAIFTRRIVPGKAPPSIVRRLFGITKPLTSRLDQRYIRKQQSLLD